MIPGWIKLAASREEIFKEILNTIDEIGGLDAAQKALSNLEKRTYLVTSESIYDRLRQAPPSESRPNSDLTKRLSFLLGLILGTGVVLTKSIDLRKTLVDVAVADENLKTHLVLWVKNKKDLPGQTFEKEITPVKYKEGVEPISTPFTEYVIPKFQEVFKEVVGRNPTITSTTEGEHMVGSFHFHGSAIDWRTKDVPAVLLSILLEALQEAFPDCDVILERNPPHIHIEPKVGSKFYTAIEKRLKSPGA